MAQIIFRAGKNTIQNLSGSGLGFFGSGGFGSSVQVGKFQDSTFVTDSNGINKGVESSNVKFLNAQSGILNTNSSGIALTAIPNEQSTLNIRFKHDTKVKTQNAEMRIYDRDNIDNDPSGVTAKVAEIIHPDDVQNNNGSGDNTWIEAHGSGVTVPFVDSPGLSGQRPNGASTKEKQHDWYSVLSSSPDSIGSKTQFGLHFELEFL